EGGITGGPLQPDPVRSPLRARGPRHCKTDLGEAFGEGVCCTKIPAHILVQLSRALADLPENYFRVGTAEIKNWLPVIAAMNAGNRRFHKIDYVPCYRSEAGTGNAMAFVYWG